MRGTVLRVVVLVGAVLWSGEARAQASRLPVQFAKGLDDAGDVLGESWVPLGEVHAQLWRAGTTIDLGGLPGSTWTSPQAINQAGQVAGNAVWMSADPSVEHAFLWEAGVMRDLGTLGGASSEARAINDRGDVAGSSATAAGEVHAFLWSGGTMLDVGALDGAPTEAIAVNSGGQVAGNASPSAGVSRAFFWSAGAMQPLGTLGGETSTATAMNDAGQVVGYSTTVSGETHAFLWQSGVMHDLGTPGHESSASAINSAGQVVGSAVGENGPHATLWEAGTATDLGALPATPLEFRTWSEARAIAELALVAGSGYGGPGGLVHAFRWASPGPMEDLMPEEPWCYGLYVNDFGEVAGQLGHDYLSMTAFFATVPAPTKAARLVQLFDQAAAAGALVGAGRGDLDRLRRRIVAASSRVVASAASTKVGPASDACSALAWSLDRVDGASRPPDLVTGASAPRLRGLLRNLMTTLGCR